MIFGDISIFAIEAGTPENLPQSDTLYVQFRFWVNNHPVGDWNDRIPLASSVKYAKEFRLNERHRLSWRFEDMSCQEVFDVVYDGFFECDYTKEPILDPNLRDRFHMDDIGMSAVSDKFGIVLVCVSDIAERIIVKDLRSGVFIDDLTCGLGLVESILKDYTEWGQSW